MKTSEREASKNHFTERRSVRTAVATISYLEDGPSDGSPVFFLHGFPDDRTGFDVSYYQHRWNVGIGSPAYQAQQAALRAAHTVDIPTTFVCGDADACTLPAVSRNVERFYTAGYKRIELAGVGHFPHREQPTAVADLIARFVDEDNR